MLYYCFCKGLQGQAEKALQDFGMNGNKGTSGWVCSQKDSFQSMLAFKTGCTLSTGMQTAKQVHCTLGSICFCLKRSSFCQKLLAANHSTFSQLPSLLPFSLPIQFCITLKIIFSVTLTAWQGLPSAAGLLNSKAAASRRYSSTCILLC